MIKKVIFTDHSNDILVKYFHDINKYPILSNDEINQLIPSAQKGNEQSIDLICKSVLRFVVTIAKQLQHKGVPLMDLISEGNYGILTAIKKYKVEKEIPFIYYAIHWIKQKMYIAIYGTNKSIRITFVQNMRLNKIIKVSAKFMQEHQREPSAEELEELTGFPLKEIKILLPYLDKVNSLDTTIESNDSETTLGELLPGDYIGQDADLHKEYVNKKLYKVLNKLTLREKAVICLIYGIQCQQMYLPDIAKLFGVCEERIRQIKEKALSRLKKYKRYFIEINYE